MRCAPYEWFRELVGAGWWELAMNLWSSLAGFNILKCTNLEGLEWGAEGVVFDQRDFSHTIRLAAAENVSISRGVVSGTRHSFEHECVPAHPSRTTRWMCVPHYPGYLVSATTTWVWSCYACQTAQTAVFQAFIPLSISIPVSSDIGKLVRIATMNYESLPVRRNKFKKPPL